MTGRLGELGMRMPCLEMRTSSISFLEDKWAYENMRSSG